ncbi:unnamed protein product [Scytosiphon promiscuus]
METRRLRMDPAGASSPLLSLTRGNLRRAVELEAGSAPAASPHLLDDDTAQASAWLADVIEVESEMGRSSLNYTIDCDELFESTSPFGLFGGSLDDVDAFNSNVFPLLSSVDDSGGDGVVLAAEGLVERSNHRTASGPVCEAEVPPVSVAGVHKYRFSSAWSEAMGAELQGLKDSKTFTVLDKLPVGEKAVSSRSVFSSKSDNDGMIAKTKARLVAEGFMQREGVNFFQTSAPTPSAASVKIVLAVANKLGYPVYHFDTAQALTQAESDCTLYMTLPGGCGDLSGKIVRLEKALYGLRQSGLLWNELLVHKFMMRHGMEQWKTDPCVFREIWDGKVVLILVHVDDMAVAGEDDEVREIHAVLNEDFTTNNLGRLSLFTGCVVAQDVEMGFPTITQMAFIETLGRRFDVSATSEFPASPGGILEARMEGESGGPWAYREAVGSLMWLVTMARPDFANAVRAVARHSHSPTERLHSPTEGHWKAVLKIIQYLLGSKYRA